MRPEPPTSKPHRLRHLGRWILAAILATFAWYGWKVYDFHLAKQEATALGWGVKDNGPIKKIRRDWRAVSRADAWSGSERQLIVLGGSEFSAISPLAKRLDANSVAITFAASLKDLSSLEELSNLSQLSVYHSEALTNIDGIRKMTGLKKLHISAIPQLADIGPLKQLNNLHELHITHCSGLSNLDALSELKSLEYLDLLGCTGLAKEAVTALILALPNTKITTPDGNTITPAAK
jgi:hypothetical protein